MDQIAEGPYEDDLAHNGLVESISLHFGNKCDLSSIPERSCEEEDLSKDYDNESHNSHDSFHSNQQDEHPDQDRVKNQER